MDTFPIIIDGRAAGSLYRRQEGLYTRFEAALPPDPALTRLWVFGGGACYDLGLMEPRPEGRVLSRRFSRARLRQMPDPIAYAAAYPASELPAAYPAAEAPPAEAPCDHGMPDCTARALPSGPLLLEREGSRFLALPCRLRRERPGLRLITLNGRTYLLFRYGG